MLPVADNNGRLAGVPAWGLREMFSALKGPLPRSVASGRRWFRQTAG